MGGQCVLAIECDWRIRKLIRANLEAVGLEVLEAVSGPHGLQLLRERRPDLILLDLDLEDMDALSLLGVFHVQFDDDPVPIVAMCAELPDRRVLRQEQLESCLQKPFSASVLLQHVQQALSNAAVGE
jgi:two-component system cell cycle response regulator DivK